MCNVGLETNSFPARLYVLCFRSVEKMEAESIPPQNQVHKENFRECLINGRLFYCDSTLPSKTKLVNYAEKNRLDKPKYTLTVINEGDAVRVTYYALVELEGKKSRGSGRTKKSAEAAASVQYLNNNYLAVGDYLQLGNSVSAPSHKYPPGAKERSRKKTERFIARKRREADAAAAAAQLSEEVDVIAVSAAASEEITSASEPLPVPVSEEITGASEPLLVPVSEEITGASEPLLVPVSEEITGASVSVLAEFAFIAYDIERSGGADDSEMLQLAFANGNQSETYYMKPSGKIDRYASSIHKIVVKQDKLWKGKQVLKSVTLKVALEEMIKFIENSGSGVDKEKKVIVCHGHDLQTLINQMSHCGLAEQFMRSFGGALDFMQIVSNASQFIGKSKSLTKLNVEKNLAEEILGEDLTRQELEENAHNAEFDSVLLYRVFIRYLENLAESEARDVMKYYKVKSGDRMMDTARLYISKISSKRRRRVGTASHGIVYINGWQN